MIKEVVILGLFAGSLAAQCGRMTVNPTTGQLDCLGVPGAPNANSSSTGAVTSLTVPLSPAVASLSQIATACYTGVGTLTPFTAYTIDPASTTSSVIFDFASTANIHCVVNANGGAIGPAGATGPAGPAPSGTGAVVVNSGTAATVTPGAAGHLLRSNGTQYVDSALQASDVNGVGAITNSTSGLAATATQLASAPSQCGANNFATGVTTFANANCSQPAFTNISGILAHAQLPTLLSADIPNNAANTTGSAASLSTATGTGAVLVAGGTPSTVSTVGLATGTYCVVITSGVITGFTLTCPGGGGGGLSLFTLTNAQLATLTNPQLLTLTN